MKRTSNGAPCWESHTPLDIGPGRVWGGNCAYPRTGCDIYVGLDTGMLRTTRMYPWVHGHEVYAPMPNMGVPRSPKVFGEMVDWLLDQITSHEAQIHVGCIGGHGRTGLLLAALAARADVCADPIAWVRDTYCEHAVESAEQVDFLVKHYGVLPATTPDPMQNVGHWFNA